MDQKGKRVDHWKLANDPKVILETLRSQRLKIVGIVVESTFNWYWLVDALMGGGVSSSSGEYGSDSAVQRVEACG